MSPAEALSPDSNTSLGRTGGLLWPLVAYLALTLVLFGIPVIGHLDSQIIAADQIDSSAEIWFLGWWPHALLHGINPFVTHAMFYPDGFNLQWATSMPLPALITTPITLAFGPVVSWNVLQLAAPTVSAWAAYLLCLDIVKQRAPSLVGGYVYGFSPYMLAHLTGSPMLALVPLPPVLVLLTRKRLQGSISQRPFATAVAILLAAQYLIDPEVLVTGTLFGAFVLLLVYVRDPELRLELRQAVKLLAAAYAGAIILITPFLYYFLFGHHYPPIRTDFSADLGGFLRPPPLVALMPHLGSAHLTYDVESYLGLPLVVLIGALSWQRRRCRAVQITTLSLLAALVASLGPELIVAGRKTGIPLPWQLVQHVPGLHYAIPVWLAVFVSLPASIIVAIWLAGRCARIVAAMRWVLAALAVTFIAPDAGNAAWNTEAVDPPFFQHNSYRAYLSSADHVLTVPAWGTNERWIADAGFPFALAAGYAAQRFPAGYTRYPTWGTLLSGRLTVHYAQQLRRFIAAKHVTAIVVQQGYPGPWRTLFGTLGVRPVATGGVLVYRLPRGT
jgi:hypothetical protein